MNFNNIKWFLLFLFANLTFAINNTAYVELYSNLVKEQNLSPTPTIGIEPGTGYSSDTQNIAPALCYVPLKVAKTSQSSDIKFSQSVNYNTIIDNFNIKNFIDSGYSKFATDGILGYLNNIKANDYSFSVSYYNKVSDWVNVDYSFNNSLILNQEGNAIYSNGNNPMFRLICGDKLIGSYEEGAALIVSLKINFNDKLSKDTFKAKFGDGANGYTGNTIINMSKVATQNNLRGDIELSAYQIGGDPSQLSKVLHNSIIKCNINDISACKAAASSIDAYAQNKYLNDSFPNQINSPDKLVPLGGIVLSADVSNIGLKLAPSYVTSEVQDARNYLISQNDKLIKYRDGFKYILDDYPVPLYFEFRSELTKTQSDSETNLNILHAKSPIDCWKFPNRCVNIKNDIQNSLPPINIPTNYWLLSQILVTKYGIKGIFWPDGAGALPSPGFLGIAHYQEYLPPDQRTGFYLINSKDASLILGSRIRTDPSDDGFSASGEFHDGGDCPYNAGYSINKQRITFGRGGCSNGTTQTYVTEFKQNPYYVDVD
ncbi:MAG: hypothetical protein ACK5Z5_05625 [Neisseriaceae bacterium]